METGLVLTGEFGDALTRLEGGENLFLTGKAGTGKSTLIRQFIADTCKNVVVAAPTGIAALNVGGYTIHRLFSFSAGVSEADVRSKNYYPRRFAKTLKNLGALIIDEASMVRADLFDCLAIALERFGPRPGTPFGGVQLVLVGDLYQLPPVVVNAEREYFRTRYETPYFFSADHYDSRAFPVVELSKVFRQIGDSAMVEILNSVREGTLGELERTKLNFRTSTDFTPPLGEFWLTLTTTNRLARARNRAMLEQIDEPVVRNLARQTGDLDGFDLPASEELQFKTGAQVMMLNNDPQDRWVNGTLALITGHRTVDDEQRVSVELPDGKMVEIRPHTWTVMRPTVESGVLRHDAVGSYTQLPFQLAWAITIHKSQGQTLERVVVDLAGGTFADGQLYVALSRCTSLNGLVLRRDVVAKDLRVDQRIRRFLTSKGSEVGARGYAYLGLCTVGDEGDRWRPRPVEFSVVTDDGREVSTLINPTRDLGASRSQYGISAGDVQLAPLLTEAWAALAPILAGRTPVGVNLDRDLGYLDFELKRHGHVVPMPVGIDIDERDIGAHDRQRLNAPSASERACAVRDLAEKLKRTDNFSDVFPDATDCTGYLMPRAIGDATNFIVGGQLHGSKSCETELAEKLKVVARQSGLDARARAVIDSVSRLTGLMILDDRDVRVTRPAIDSVLVPGARVCFTGSVSDEAGRRITRETMKELATNRGLSPVSSMTKSKCDALVSAEVGSQSSKAQQAAKWSKPVFTADEFLRWIRGEEPEPAVEVVADVAITRVSDFFHVYGSQPPPLEQGHSPAGTRMRGQRMIAPKALRDVCVPLKDAVHSVRPIRSADAGVKMGTGPTDGERAPLGPAAREATRRVLPRPLPAPKTTKQKGAGSSVELEKSAGLQQFSSVPAETPVNPEYTVAGEGKPAQRPATRRDQRQSKPHRLPRRPQWFSTPSRERDSSQARGVAPSTPIRDEPYPRRRRWDAVKRIYEGQRRFHIAMAAVLIFLTVGMFAFAVISVAISPGSTFWIGPVGLSWLAAVVQIPIWAVWSLKRMRQPRR